MLFGYWLPLTFPRHSGFHEKIRPKLDSDISPARPPAPERWHEGRGKARGTRGGRRGVAFECELLRTKPACHRQYFA